MNKEETRATKRSCRAPETRISLVFARCRPTQPRYGVDPSVGLNYTLAARAGTVVCPDAAAATLLMILHWAIMEYDGIALFTTVRPRQ